MNENELFSNEQIDLNIDLISSKAIELKNDIETTDQTEINNNIISTTADQINNNIKEFLKKIQSLEVDKLTSIVLKLPKLR